MNVAGIVKRKTQALSRLQIVKNFLPPVQQAREQEGRERSPERKGSLARSLVTLFSYGGTENLNPANFDNPYLNLFGEGLNSASPPRGFCSIIQ